MAKRSTAKMSHKKKRSLKRTSRRRETAADKYRKKLGLAPKWRKR